LFYNKIKRIKPIQTTDLTLPILNIVLYRAKKLSFVGPKFSFRKFSALQEQSSWGAPK